MQRHHEAGCVGIEEGFPRRHENRLAIIDEIFVEHSVDVQHPVGRIMVLPVELEPPYPARGDDLGERAASERGYVFFGLDPILGFWLASIFTRPLGASFGDLLSQPSEYGGLGLGTIITSALFLTAIIGIVAYMSLTHDGDEMVANG